MANVCPVAQVFRAFGWENTESMQDWTLGYMVMGCMQVVSDYLTPYDGEMRMMRSNNQPVVVYSYRMRFWRDPANTLSSA